MSVMSVCFKLNQTCHCVLHTDRLSLHVCHNLLEFWLNIFVYQEWSLKRKRASQKLKHLCPWHKIVSLVFILWKLKHYSNPLFKLFLICIKKVCLCCIFHSGFFAHLSDPERVGESFLLLAQHEGFCLVCQSELIRSVVSSSTSGLRGAGHLTAHPL